MNWKIRTEQVPKHLDELMTILLKNRELDQEDDFFQPVHPSKISLTSVGLDEQQLQTALKRIKQAIKNEEEIVVFGDYDADGVCATAVLWQTLYRLKAKAVPFIPHREKHGYGLSAAALTDLLAVQQPRLIITVDNGIVAHEHAQQIAAAGIDLIITDHHQPEAELPLALAVVHTDQLCGTTVAWMLANQLARSFDQNINDQLDLTGIATIADQVLLKAANRSFAYHGLAQLQKSKKPGLLALLSQAGINQKDITSQTVGYAIAPRINAMGRLGHSLDALRLVLTNNAGRAAELAELLGSTNNQRQELTYEMMADALSNSQEWREEHLIIAASADYHEGVIGLIAGRLVERFYKPAIAMSISEKTVKASARSIPGVNIIELIRQVKAELLEVGGHPMAAGFGFETTKLELVTTKLRQLAKEQIDQSLLQPSLEVDIVLPEELLTLATADAVQRLAPFGSGNPEPVFGIKEVELLEVMTVGKEKQHLKLVGRVGESVQPINFLAWRKGELAQKLSAGDKVDIAGVLEINEWRHRTSLQVRVVDILHQLKK